MRALNRRLSAVLAIGLLTGCGGSSTPTKSQAEVPSVASDGNGETPQPDLSPVEAPEDLIAVGRLKDPGRLVDTFTDWVNLPIDWRKMLAAEEPGLDRVILFDAPVEAAVALDPTGPGNLPQPFMVFSVGLSSLDGALAFAREKGESVRQIQTGVYRLESDELSESCVIAAAVGPAPARLVCGDRPEDVDALLPYATRGLPLASMGDSDLHVEVRAEPFRRRYSHKLRQLKTLGPSLALRELRLDAPRFDRAMADTVHAVADEVLALTEDVDRVAVDVWAQREKQQMKAQASIRFSGKHSWSVGVLADSASRARPAPEVFWRLPADAQLAGYSVGTDAKRFQPIRRTLAQLVEGYLAHENVPRRARSQLVDVIEQAWTGEVETVYARGAVTAKNTDDMTASQRAAEALRQSVGWHLMGIEDKSDRYRKALDQLASVYTDRQLRQTLDKQLDIDPKELPALKVRAAVGKGLAPGARRYELVIPGELVDELASEHRGGPGKRGKPQKVSLILVLMPQGERTWISISADEKAAYARLAEVGSKSNAMSERAGLGQLRTGKAVSGGYFSLSALLSSGGPMMDALVDSSTLSRARGTMPHHGETPIVYSFVVNDAEKVEATWTVTLPKAIFEDLAALAPLLASQGGGMLAPASVMP